MLWLVCFVVWSSVALAISADMGATIVGGHLARDPALGFTVSLQRKKSHFCAGTLIHPRWVMTAAHCVAGNQRPDRVVMGLLDLSEPQGGEIRKVIKVVLHDQYSRVGWRNDIALLKLNRPVKSVHPVQLAPNDDLEKPKTTLDVVGWGRTSEFGASSSQLRQVSVPVVPQRECKARYGAEIDDSKICAGYRRGGKDSCKGDSGGPLFSGGVQVGIVSYGRGCARARSYGVYTRVSFHLDDFVRATLSADRDELTDWRKSPTAHPTTASFAAEVAFCKRFRRRRSACGRRHGSRCFWHKDAAKKNKCLPLEMRSWVRPVPQSFPTPAP